jgi:hypothetical protein
MGKKASIPIICSIILLASLFFVSLGTPSSAAQSPRAIVGKEAVVGNGVLHAPENVMPPQQAPCPPDSTRLMGCVVCPNGDYRPGCDVEVRLFDSNTADPFDILHTRTNECGCYAICIPCPPASAAWAVEVRALCCGGSFGPVPLQGCPPVFPLPAIVCPDCEPSCPPGHVRAEGQVVCANGVPVPGCEVRLAAGCAGHQHPPVIAMTDGQGFFRACVPCPPDCSDWTLRAVATCCGNFSSVDVQGCPQGVQLAPIVCDPCPLRCDSGETLVEGGVFCHFGGPGRPPIPMPVPDCDVRIRAFDCNGDIVLEEIVTTDPRGHYELCVPCACPPSHVEAVALCCGAAQVAPLDGCPLVMRLPNLVCPGPCGHPCPAAGQTRVSGRVLCDNGTPMPNCPVMIHTEGCGTVNPPIQVGTDAQGYYEACISCFPNSCPDWHIVVESGCCPVTLMQPAHGCPPEVQMPAIVCSNCGQQPCPTGQTMVRGVVACDNGTPMPNCPVMIHTEGCGTVNPPIQVTTDAQGHYEACVPCFPNTCPGWHVVAESGCCPGSVMHPVQGCPPEVQIPPIICGNCGQQPCPTGQTMVRGVVVCDDGTPMPNCPVMIHTEGCGTVNPPNQVTTDAQGHYEACVPCFPNTCPGWHVVAESGCCPVTLMHPVQGCPPEVQMPGIICTGC